MEATLCESPMFVNTTAPFPSAADRIRGLPMLTQLVESLSSNTTSPMMLSNNSGERPPYLQRLAHLDEGLYQDFYGLWISLMVINSLIFLVGLVMNSLALYVFCFRTKPRSASVIYTINLAVTDLMVNLSLPTRILLYSSGGACLTCSYLHIFSYFVNMYCSILFLTCICVDRYLAIVQVEASRRWRSTNAAKCVCVSVWLFAIVVTYSFLSTAFRHTGCCVSKLLFLTVLEFFLPLVIIAAFTLRIMCALADRRLMQQSRERRRRAVQLLITVLVIFTVCFTPFHVRQVLVHFYPDMPHHVITYHVTVTLSSLNSCLDPVVYCFVTNNFQATMRGLFRRLEAEPSSREIISMQHSSKGSGQGGVVRDAGGAGPGDVVLTEALEEGLDGGVARDAGGAWPGDVVLTEVLVEGQERGAWPGTLEGRGLET